MNRPEKPPADRVIDHTNHRQVPIMAYVAFAALALFATIVVAL